MITEKEGSGINSRNIAAPQVSSAIVRKSDVGNNVASASTITWAIHDIVLCDITVYSTSKHFSLLTNDPGIFMNF